MNKNQNRAFWALYIGFVITGTIGIYLQGAFTNIGKFGVLILFVAYLAIAYEIHKFVEKPPDVIEKRFE